MNDLVTFDNLTKRIEFLLELYPYTRDSDKELWLAYMNYFYKIKYKMNEGQPTPYEAFKKIFLDDNTPSMESIRRTRQKIQESGKFLSEKRKIKIEDIIKGDE